MKFIVPALSKITKLLFVLSLSAFASAPLLSQIAPSSPPLNPPMWPSDPTVTGTNDWDQWKKNCHDMTAGFGKDTFLSCATSTFRSRPFHFLAQSVVPGSGVGGGGYYGRDLNRDIWQNKLEFTGVMTIRQFCSPKQNSPPAARTSAPSIPTKISLFRFTRATNRCRIFPSTASARTPMSTTPFSSASATRALAHSSPAL